MMSWLSSVQTGELLQPSVLENGLGAETSLPSGERSAREINTEPPILSAEILLPPDVAYNSVTAEPPDQLVSRRMGPEGWPVFGSTCNSQRLHWVAADCSTAVFGSPTERMRRPSGSQTRSWSLVLSRL